MSIDLDVIVSSTTTGCCNVKIIFFTKFTSIKESQNRTANIDSGQFFAFNFFFYFIFQNSGINCIDSLRTASGSFMMHFHVFQDVLNNVILGCLVIFYKMYVVHQRDRNITNVNFRHVHSLSL